MQDSSIRRKYHEILSDFVNSEKLYQVVDSEENSSFIKDQIDFILSRRGWEKRIVALDFGGSVHLINPHLARIYSLQQSPSAQRLTNRKPRVVNGRYILRIPAQLELQDRPFGEVTRSVIIQHPNNKVSIILHYADGSHRRF